MRSLAIVNQKGGSGKTTTAVNMAAALAERNHRVLLVDLDPQASASHWLGVKNNGGGSLFDMFTGKKKLTDLVQGTNVAGVEVAPSSSSLLEVDKVLADRESTETILKRNLEHPPGGGWDYVLVDSPPNLGILTINALAGVAEVCVPVEAHVLALNGLVQILKTVELVKRRFKPELAVSGILACRVDARTRHALEIVENLRERFNHLVYDVVIRENIRLAECPSFGQPITQYASRSCGAKDYRALAEEVVRQERSS